MMDNPAGNRSGKTSESHMSNTKTVYVTVALEVLRDADVQDIMSECDYSFEHADIVDTELMGESDYA
jgi:hypothetical protein